MTLAAPLHGAIPQALKGELVRHTLLQQLDQYRDMRAIAVVAPSGYGKTTLLAQFARNHAENAAWLTLSPREAEPIQLQTALIQVLAGRFPRLDVSQALKALEGPWSPERAAQTLARDLDLLDCNLRLVLDQAEHLGPDAVRWLNAFLAGLADGHQVLLSAFDAQPLRLSHLLARQQVVVLGSEQLAFTVQETRELLSGTNSSAQTLHQQYEGWPVCISLVAAGAGHHITPEDLLADALQHLDDTTLGWLTEASVITSWSEAQFDVHGIGCPFDWERQLRQSGLPVLPLGQQQYRPHGLLLRALQNRLRNQPERYLHLHRTAARVAEAEHRLQDAIAHHLAIKDTPAALQVAQQVVNRLLERYEYNLIRQILERFHPAGLTTSLKYALVQSWMETGDLTRAEQMLQTIQDVESPVTPLMLRAFVASRRAAHQEALQLCSQALEASSSPRTTIPLLRLKGWELLQTGRCPEALQQFQQALALGDVSPTERVHLLFMLAHAQEKQLADFEVIEDLYQQAIEGYSLLGCKRCSIPVLIQLAELCAQLGQFELAKQHLDRAFLACEDIEDSFMTAVCEAYGDLFSLMGLFDQASAHYGRALEVSRRSGSALYELRIRHKQVEVCLKTGQDHRPLWEEIRQLPQDGDLYRNICTFYRGLVQLCEGAFQEAFKTFESLQQASIGTFRKIRLHVLLRELRRHAGVAAQQDNDQLQQLTRGRPLVCLQQDDLLLKPLQPERSPLVARDLPAFSTAPGVPIAATLFGEIRFVFQGHPFTIKHKKSAEVLVWLLLYGPATRDRIITDLHDGDNSSKHIDYFKVAVRRLRSAMFEETGLELNPLQFHNGMYRVAEQLNFTVDFLECEQRLKTLKLTDLHQVIEAYKKEFMPGHEASWVERLRSRIQENLRIAYQKCIDLEHTAKLKVDLSLDLLELTGWQEELLEQVNNCIDQLDCDASRVVYIQKLRAIKQRWLA